MKNIKNPGLLNGGGVYQGQSAPGIQGFDPGKKPGYPGFQGAFFLGVLKIF